MDQPRRPAPQAAARLGTIRLQLMADEPPISDPLALREQLHRDADACNRRQGELRLVAKLPTDRET